MFPKFSSDSKGQALVEFALILVVLLLFIFIIIEAGRLFQGNLTVQNAARAAGRYAMTGQFETDCLFEFPACLDARVTSIKRESRRAGGGLAIDENAPAGEKNSYITEIYSQDNAGNWIPDDAGGPGEPIRIIVRFQMPVVTPLLRPFAESVRLTGRVTVQAENFDQYGVVENSVAPPNPGNPGGGTGPPEADVAISKSATPSTVLVKYPVDYTIDVWNLGPFDAEELVTVVDTLPEGSTYVGFTPDVRGTDCTEDPVGTVTCTMPNLDKDPGPTNSATVILHTLAPADAGVITNTATIDAGPTTFDPFLPNNTTEITVTVRREWADLSVEITDIPDPVRESELLTYTVKVSNRNYEAATDVVMTSTLSADTTFDSVDDPLGICNESGGLVTCNIGDLALDADYLATIVVRANDDEDILLPRSIFMTASVVGIEFDPELSNNSATEETFVADAWADLAITKEGPDGPIATGESFNYLLNISNNGPDPVITTTVTDTLPVGMVYQSMVSAVPAIVSCTSPDLQNITCDLTAPINSGDNVQVVLSVRSVDPGSLTNVARVTGALLDPYLDNNSSQHETSIADADLTLKKLAPLAVDAGDTITYTIIVTNTGPGPAEGVRVVDILPDNITNVLPWPSVPCTLSDGIVTCAFGTMAVNDVITAQITAIAPDQNEIVNEAYTFYDYPDLDNTDNSMIVTTTTTLVADLELSKFAFTEYDPANQEGLTGETLRYLLQISSLGPSPADGIVVTDTLPASVEYSGSTPDGRCAYIDISHEVRCDMGGLVLGPTINIFIEVTPTLPGLITNTAVVTGAQVDYVPDNNETSIGTRILPADLRLQKSATAAVLVSDTITYTLVVSNAGPSVATEVVITDTLPVSVTSPVATSSLGNCDDSGNPVVCSIGTLAVGDTAYVTMTVLASADGTAVNEAMARAKETIEIDVAQAATAIGPVTDLAVGKTASSPSYAGEPLTYTLTITNYGPSVARTVLVTDTLPGEVTFVEAVTPGNNCNENGGTVTCTVDSIVRDGTATVTIGTIAGLEGIYVNSADVGGGALDPDSLNNSTTISTTILPAADLDIAKSHSGLFLAGEPFTYTLQVTNKGPSTAESVIFTDTLPEGIVFEAFQPPAANCSYNGARLVVCQPGNLADGASAIVTIKVSTFVTGFHTNNAEASSATTDLYPGDNTIELVTFIRPVANLSIEKENVTPTAVAGEQHTYAVSVTNSGPNVATSVTVSDTLPSGMTYESATVDCAETGGIVTCDLGALAVNGSTSFEITVDVASSVGHNDTLTNEAEVGATEADRDLTDNTATVDTLVIRRADMTVVKSDDGSSATAGGTYPYTITVTNDGPSVASSVIVTDALPAFTDYNSASIAGCSESGGIVTCNLPDVASGDSFTFTLTLDLDPGLGDGDTITNWAYVSAAEEDPDGGNNSDSETTNVVRSANLELQKSDDGSPAVVEEEYTYTLLVTNNGPSDASNVAIDDTLPPDTIYVSGSPGCFSDDGVEVTCDIVGGLGFGDSATVTITMQVLGSAMHGSTITNTATASALESDPDFGDNTDTESTLVLGKADLGISKTDSGQMAVAGGEFVYKITVSNNGPSDATGIEVIDTLPGPMTYVGSTDSCSAAGQVVTCLPGDIASTDAPTTFFITVTVLSSAADNITVTNQVEVSAGQVDPNIGNNSASDDTRIIRETDLLIEKSDTGSRAIAGGVYTYTLSVTNGGPSEASGVTVTDTLPLSTTYLASTGGICDPPAGLDLTCPINSLAAGATRVFTVSVSVDASLGQDSQLQNRAGVFGNETDPGPNPNYAEVFTFVDRAADLSLQKNDEGVDAIVDEDYTYTILVANGGPSNAGSVTVTDTLPISTTFVSATDGCDPPVSGEIVCDVGDLIPGAPKSLTVTVHLNTDLDHGDFITNSATIGGNVVDPDSSNNGDSVVTQVIGQADLAIAKTDFGDDAVAGDQFVYQITVTNTGPSQASGIVVADTLPGVMTYVGSTDSCSADVSGRNVTCNLGSLDVGLDRSFLITVSVASDAQNGATVTNTAIVDSEQYDANPLNDTAEEKTDLVRQADLAITKTGDAMAVAGRNYTYTITVDNLGLSDASGVVVTDTLPSGVSYVGSEPDICTPAGLELTCNLLDDVAANNNFDFTITVFVPPTLADGVDLINKAGVSAVEADPASGNDVTDLTTTVERIADLGVVKSDNGGPAEVGQNHTYTITVSNNGPSDATGIVITDTLPVSTTAVLPAGCTAPDARTIRCDVGNLDVGANRDVQLTVLVSPTIAHATLLTNRVEVDGIESDGEGDNNSFELDTTAVREIDLKVEKDAENNDAIAGQTFTYYLDVTNLDNQLSAANVIVTDTLPISTTFATAQGANCSPDNGSVTCNLGDLAPGATPRITLTITLSPSVPQGTITNTVVVTGDVADPDLTSNLDEVVSPVDRLTDLVISKSGVGATATAGDLYTYVITVTNEGDSDASGVVVTDTRPVSSTLDFPWPPECDPAGGGRLRCVVGELPSGDSAVIFVTIEVNSDVADGAQIVNYVEVTGNENEEDLTNNDASATTDVVRTSDLRVEKDDGGMTAIAGRVLTYTIMVFNDGPSDATGIVISDTLPDFTVFHFPTGTCSPIAGGQRCAVGDIAAGGSKPITFSVALNDDIAQGTVITNSVIVGGNETDPNGGNSAFEESTVNRLADMAISKAGSGSTVIAGEPYTYTLTVTNTGPSVASSVVVTDFLPSQTTFISSTGDVCTNGGGPLTCSAADLDVGESGQIEINVRVLSSAGDGITMTNQASVDAAEADDNPVNDSASLDTFIERQADLEITKSDSGADAVAGESYSYSVIVRNNGPSDASGVIFTDTLPVSTTLSAPVTGCAPSAGNLVCTVGTLTQGDQQLFTITVDVDQAVADNTTITNAVEVDGDEADPDSGNNTADEDTLVFRRADLAIGKFGPATVPAGEQMSYTLVVTNYGPSLASGVSVSDTLPAGLTDIVTSTLDFKCPGAGSLDTCTLNELDANSTALITILARPLITDVITNTATVSANEIDLIQGNNEDSISTIVIPAADLFVVLDPSSESIDTSKSPLVEFTISMSITNLGPSPALNVVLTETLTIAENKIEFVSDNLGACTRIAGQPIVSCVLDTVPVAVPRLLEITLNATAAGNYFHTSTVGSSTADPYPDNNSATGLLLVQ